MSVEDATSTRLPDGEEHDGESISQDFGVLESATGGSWLTPIMLGRKDTDDIDPAHGRRAK